MSGGSWQFVLLGLGVGTLVGMTGMGGGSLMTPLLILVFGFDPGKAVGTDLIHGGIFKSFGAARHRALGTPHLGLVFWMLCGSAPMSLVGVWISHQLGKHAIGLQTQIIAVALILGGIGFMAKTFVKRGVQASDAPFHLRPRDKAIALALGASGGFVVGLTSVGSGTFFGLTMLLVYPLTAQKIVGTDVAHAAALLWVAGASHLLHGNVNLHAMAWLLVGSIPGVLLGSHMSIRVPDRLLRIAFAIVLVLSGIRIVGVPDADKIAVAGLALAAVGFAVWGVRRMRRPLPAFEGD